jgi:hypothetical protein
VLVDCPESASKVVFGGVAAEHDTGDAEEAGSGARPRVGRR